MTIEFSVKPASVQLRQNCSLEIMVSSSKTLGKGDLVEFQFPNSWSLFSGPSFTRDFQTENPEEAHYVSVSADNAKFKISIEKKNWYFDKGVARHGRTFTAEIVSGEIKPEEKIRIAYENTYAPYIAETSQIQLRVAGEEPEKMPEVEVIAGEHEKFRVIVPSYAAPGEGFEINLVSLDRYENASSTQFKNKTLKDESGKVIKDDICFTGFMKIPYKIESEGVYRFLLDGTVSNAIKITKDKEKVYWGDIHIHTKYSHDAQGNNPYLYAKNVSCLDFAASAEHWESLGENGYKAIEKWLEDENEAGKFATIPADERNPPELMGHHNVYFRDMESFKKHQAFFDGDIESGLNGVTNLQDADKTRVMLIPHHTGLAFSSWKPSYRGCSIKWDAFDDYGLRPATEIYSHHGQSELYSPQHFLAYEWNRMRNPERRANSSVPGPHYAQDYWMSGKRIGVIGSSDEHSGLGGKTHGGIAAAISENLSREDIFDAILNRKTYATTGERILVEFSVDGIAMGDYGTRKVGDKISISLKVWGTNILLRAEILKHVFGRDNTFIPIASDAPRPEGLDADVSVEDTIEGSCMYYARITQEPIEWPGMAWTTPIWVDV